MHIIRLIMEKEPTFGILQGQSVYSLEGSPYDEYGVGSYLGNVSFFNLLAPVVPTKIIGIARNTYSLIQARGWNCPLEPEFFLKPPSSVIGTNDRINLPYSSEEVVCEGELAIVIGRKGKNISVEEAQFYILGYSCANDITARDIMLKDRLVARSKSFDTFCPLGPAISTEVITKERRLVCRVNNQIVTDFAMEDYIFTPTQIVSYLSHFFTLLPGDVVLCGSAAGQRKLQNGDLVTVEIETIGQLCNVVGVENDH